MLKWGLTPVAHLRKRTWPRKVKWSFLCPAGGELVR